MDSTMFVNILGSDFAIIIYELAGIAVLLFFVLRLSRKQKVWKQEEEIKQKAEQEERLKNSLKNKQRR